MLNNRRIQRLPTKQLRRLFSCHPYFEGKSGPGFGHGSVPVLATITDMPPSSLVPIETYESFCSIREKYPSVHPDRCQSLGRFLRLWSWLPRFDS